MNRRQFLGLGALTGTGALAGAYSSWFGVEGWKDFGDFVKGHFYRTEDIPDEKILVDSHAHFSRDVNLAELINTIFNRNVSMQSVTTRKGSEYLEFKDIKDAKIDGIESVFCDEYSLVLRRGEKYLVLTASEEFETILKTEGRKKEHGIHIVAEGIGKIDSEETYAVLRGIEREKGSIILAHPYTIPVETFVFLPANKKEEEDLEKICQEFDVFIEGMNGPNTLWMVGTNGLSRELAIKNNVPLIYNSDSHPNPNINLVRKMVGSVGTLIPGFDFRGMNGREIIERKYQLIRESGKMYGLPWNTFLFGRVMV